MERLIDSHSHINDEALINDVSNILDNMKEFGVEKVLIPGWNIESSLDAIRLSNEHNEFYAAVGIHPENIDGLSLNDVDKIKKIASDKRVIAIGEIGLDYHYTKENKELQKEFLIKQLELAEELDLPVLIHERDATEDYLMLIKEFFKTHKKRENIGIMHSYSGSAETMKELIKLGFYISFSGPVTFKNARVQKECAILCPLDRILVETDAPYLTPVPYRGKRNEPKNVYYVLEEISKLKNIDINELNKNVYNNFVKLFRLGDLK